MAIRVAATGSGQDQNDPLGTWPNHPAARWFIFRQDFALLTY